MPDILHVDPQRLTAVREAYDNALNELGKQLDDLRRVGFVDRPWLGDDVSEDVRLQYNGSVMESPLGAYQAMRKYEIELTAIRDHIAEAEKAYLAGDSAIADRTPRLA